MPHAPPWMHRTHERRHPAHRIRALVAALQHHGVPPADALRGTGLDPAHLADPQCTTSIAQHRHVCRQALGLAAGPALAFEAGAALHLPGQGACGLVLMSCASGTDYLRLATRYQGLSPAPLAFEAEAADGAVRIRLENPAADVPPDLAAFLAELALMEHLTHLRDAFGNGIRPLRAQFAHPASAHRTLCEHHLGCPCEFERDRTELHVDTALLHQAPVLADAVASRALQAACDRLLEGQATDRALSGRVQAALHDLGDPGAGLKAVATALGLGDRTLRRRLHAEGTSFSALAHEARHGVAVRHLVGSDASIDEIAARAGFSDTANFRRAFLRQEKISPAAFRQRHANAHAPSSPRT